MSWAGSKYPRTCADRNFVLQTESQFSVLFSVRLVLVVSNWGRSRRHPCFSSVTKVTFNKLALVRKNVLILLYFARQCGGGTDSQRGRSRTVLHEGVQKAECDWDGEDLRVEGRLCWRNVVLLRLPTSPLCPLLSSDKNSFSRRPGRAR